MTLVDSSVWIDYFNGIRFNDHALLHRDRDFAPMERWLGLRVA